MSWDFETEPEFQKELDWITEFVRKEVEPLDHILGNPYDIQNPRNRKIVPKLQEQVRRRGLWACHLGPELGGPGYGQLKLALMNEILGRSRFAPIVFGCQAPDTGNSEILAHYGTPELKERFLKPLLNNEIVSCFSMTEPHAGADPKMFKCKAERDGDQWVINGQKWFSSNARLGQLSDCHGRDRPGRRALSEHVHVRGAGRHAGHQYHSERRYWRRGRGRGRPRLYQL